MYGVLYERKPACSTKASYNIGGDGGGDGWASVRREGQGWDGVG